MLLRIIARCKVTKYSGITKGNGVFNTMICPKRHRWQATGKTKRGGKCLPPRFAL